MFAACTLRDIRTRVANQGFALASPAAGPVGDAEDARPGSDPFRCSAGPFHGHASADPLLSAAQSSVTRQISSAYSRMERSEENHAIRAVLRIALAHQPAGSIQAQSISRWARQ